MRPCAAAFAWLALALTRPALGAEPEPVIGVEPEPAAGRSEARRLMEEAQDAAAAGEAERALALMERAAATGDAEALNGLATFVGSGVGTSADEKRRRELLERAVAAGSRTAKLNLGLTLLQSADESDEGVDPKRALQLLRGVYDAAPLEESDRTLKAVAAGGLGIAYVFGLGTEADVARGVALLEECDAGRAAWSQIHFLLGRAYESGWGEREPDAEKAYAQWWTLANDGDPRAQWRVAMALLAGEGAPLDEGEAYLWARKAAEAGFVDAEISTAVMLAMGQGTPEDDREARAWYTRAAEKGSAHALRGLGFMLATGEGGEREAARGWAYLTLAADAGEETARRALEALEREVSDADKEQAKAIAQAWVRNHGKPAALEQ